MKERNRLPSYSIWYVSFFAQEQGETRFSPQEFIINNTGRDFRPLDMLPITPGFGEYRLKQREVQSALDFIAGQPDHLAAIASERAAALLDDHQRVRKAANLAVDREGNVYVVESYYDSLLVFSAQGDFLMPIGGTGTATGRFYLPAGVWADDSGQVTELHNIWRFDEVFSSSVLMDFDKNANLKLDPDELAAIGETVRTSLEEFSYYTTLTMDGKVVPVTKPDIINVDIKDGQLLMFFALKPKSEWRFDTKEEIQDAIREVLKDFPGVAFAFNQPIEMRVSELILGVRGDLAVRIYGPDLAVLNNKSDEIATALRGISGAQDVYYIANEGVQYLRALPDADALMRYGLSVDALSELLRTQIEGVKVGMMLKDGRRYPLMLKGAGAEQSPDSLAAMPVHLPNGERVSLSQLATIERVSGPVQISRELGSRNTVVIANVRGRDLVGFVDEARRAVQAQVQLPAGYRLVLTGRVQPSIATCRAPVLLPIRSITSGWGPMKISPASVHARAKSSFSARKP